MCCRVAPYALSYCSSVRWVGRFSAIHATTASRSQIRPVAKVSSGAGNPGRATISEARCRLTPPNSCWISDMPASRINPTVRTCRAATLSS